MLSSSKERELDQVQARIVRLVLILALCVSRVFGQQQNSTRILDVKVKDLATFEQKYAQRIKCFKMLDTVLTSKWSQEYEKINTTHAYSQGTVYSGQSISKNGYDNVWQEWVMEKNSTSGAIDSCLRILVPEILPMLNQEDIDCLNTAFISHVKAENVHENKFKEYLKKQSEAQPIFRRCVGTFCAARDLASVSAKEYALEKEPDGTYRVVPSSPTIKAGARNESDS